MTHKGPINRRIGLVLRTHALRDRDLVLRILIEDGSKISCAASGARGSRYGSPLDMLDHGRFELRTGRGSMMSLISYQAINSYRPIREDLNRFLVATSLAECTDFLVPEDGPTSPVLFELLCSCLDTLTTTQSAGESLRVLHIGLAKLLEITGFGDASVADAPSYKNLQKLLDCVESAADRQLQSRSSMGPIWEDLRREQPSKTDAS